MNAAATHVCFARRLSERVNGGQAQLHVVASARRAPVQDGGRVDVDADVRETFECDDDVMALELAVGAAVVADAVDEGGCDVTHGLHLRTVVALRADRVDE